MKRPIEPDNLKQLFLEARSFNAFTSSPVSDGTLNALYDLIKWGPTSMNCQPARYVFIRSSEHKSRLISALSPGNVEKTKNAPITAIVASDTRFYEHLPEQFKAYDAKPIFEGNPELSKITSFRNSSLQGAFLIMGARALGLDCGPMSGFDSEKIDAEFFPDGRWKTNFLINIGYGNSEANYPRGPRLSFDQVAQII